MCVWLRVVFFNGGRSLVKEKRGTYSFAYQPRCLLYIYTCIHIKRLINYINFNQFANRVKRAVRGTRTKYH